MTATNQVRIHHRGGGVPGVGFVDRHYCLFPYADGTFFLQFGPEHDTSTMGENHVVLGVCFDGNREIFPVLDSEIQALAAGMAEARKLGYVTDHPRVLPHDSPLLRHLGNATACPGNHVTEPTTWAKVVAATQAGVDLPAPIIPAGLDKLIVPDLPASPAIVSLTTFEHHSLGTCAAAVRVDGAVYTSPANAYQGGANGQSYFKGRAAAKIRAVKEGDPKTWKNGYVIVAMSGETYFFGVVG